jgi:endo-1,4-beta-xylanase
MRISREGGLSFGDRGATPDAATQASWLQVATDPETPGGYLVEAAISLQGAGGPATYQGLDLQVNDGANGARVALYNWADPTDNGYQSTAHWGVALLAPAPVPPPPPPAELSPTLSTVVRGQDDSPTVGQARLADGQDAQTILVTLRDSDGAPLEGLADQIDVVADRAGLVWDQAEDRGDGVYSLRLLADTAGRWQVSVLVGQVALADTASVNFLAASLSDSSVEPGQRVTATGSGFLPGESVRAQLGTTDLGSVLADLVSGTATVAFSVPTGLAAGTHTLTLTGATSGTVTVSFTVARVPDEPTPPTPQAPPGGWADPASGSTVPLALLGLLLVAGGIRLLRRVGLTS